MTLLSTTEDHRAAGLPVGQDNGYAFDLYARYRRDPLAVPADWRLWFEALDAPGPAEGAPAAVLVERLVDSYRRDGHLGAALDPLGLSPRHETGRLARDRAAVEALPGPIGWRLGGAAGQGRGRDLVALLDRIYRGPAALEAEAVEDEAARAWIETRFEALALAEPGPQDRARAHRAIGRADTFEQFVRLKFPTKKRFGSEGAEGMMLLMQELLRQGARAGLDEVVMGGMHRGRLALLATVLGKDPARLLAEIKGRDLTRGGPDFTGDVPYHLGHVAEVEIEGRRLALSIAPHPSHLMVVAAVATGMARARREGAPAAAAQAGPGALCLLLHTDAAFAGQGITAELAQMGRLDGYDVGGTIHLVVNNQIGFTTLPSEGRSARYCTDVAKMVGAPVIHVNGDDAGALMAAAALAADWRARFGRDIFIDLVCYRRNGHNELDEPRFTQPATWAAIDARPGLRAATQAALAAADPPGAAAVEAELAAFRDTLVAAYDVIDSLLPNDDAPFQPGWDAVAAAGPAEILAPVDTGVDAARLVRLGAAAGLIAPAASPHPKVRQFYAARAQSLERGEGVGFATAEALAFASLLDEGASVRLSGQDSVRGTFTQRHLRLHDTEGPASRLPLAALARDGARFEIHNSPLSEYAVLGFEYGHSLVDPGTLTLWEAQFGDFLNGAQIVVDQYVVSAEAKWGLRSGLVILLPHGLEGQGPDHSSCRPERLLQACVGANAIVANPSTPANLFHLLRRQIRAPWRKPLFVVAPKSLLRARAAVSRLDEMGPGTGFRPLIYDGPEAPERLVLCSGKIAYELAAARAEAGLAARVGILRVEQLYPLDRGAVTAALARAGAQVAARLATGPLVWCQEEPRNQGAFAHVRAVLAAPGPAGSAPIASLGYAGRPALPVAAGGSIDRHVAEQDTLVRSALGL
ncbi:2-oxoglutarate dehydrogenase E1 component [Frigidibacter sp. MR17.24]|uniref:2-oxoglutarate dehydrogenase E1 component n=1 Tax=Frigidibacter sp. MR17.24 TaxID=3127345 RepID=UPI003012EE74